MKLQYLGDSKDSFKWDYHDYLVSALNYPLLNIALMMTPDDKSGDGKTSPLDFPARAEIIEFCKFLREQRSIEAIKDLPKKTSASYTVKLHRNSEDIDHKNREKYFSEINPSKQVLFIDPDIGFEPKRISKKHIGYRDISQIIKQVSDETVLSVFQYNNRKENFINHFDKIKERMESVPSTAIFSPSLMFVNISKSKEVIEQVRKINQEYADNRGIKTIV